MGHFCSVSRTVGGREASKKPPLLIAYNGVHYEQLKPKTKRDEFLTKKLVENMKNSEIVLRYEQCPIFDELEKRKESDSSTHRNDKESWANVVRGRGFVRLCARWHRYFHI